MPLTEKVAYTTTLQHQNKVQIPKLIRWRFKIDTDQPLKVGVNFLDMHMGLQFFYTKMRKDGRITIPKLVLDLFAQEDRTLEGCPIEVMIEPA